MTGAVRIPRRKKKVTPEKIILYVIASIWVFICLFPIYDLVAVAFSTEDTNPLKIIVPNSFSAGINNFQTAFEYGNIIKATTDTFIYTVIAIIGMLIICSLAAYEFVFYRFPAKNLLFAIVMGSMMLPNILYIIPLFRMIFAMGLSDTYLGVAIPFMVSPLSVFILKQFAENLPNDLVESARIDGAGHFRIYFSIILPLMRNGLITATVLLFLKSWGAFLWPSLVSSQNVSPMSVSINNMLHPNFYVPTRVRIAAMIVAMIPPLLIYIFFQKKVIEGMAMQGIKG